MDSLTQIALGGAVGYAVLGNKVGRKAIVWGAVLGTLPDLDVFLPYSGEVEAFTYHRGFSHSLLMHILVSPFIAWLIVKLHPATSAFKKEWFWLAILTLSTHAILDSFTVYGTQLFWPLTEYPVGISNLFIIDPLYTLPLLFGLAIAAMPKMSALKATRMNTLGLVLSSAYIAWSLVAKVYIDNKIEASLSLQGIDSTRYVSTPAPLTTLLWRTVVMSNNKYYEGYASLFDSPKEITFTPYENQTYLIDDIKNEWGVERLQWFTKGFYAIKQDAEKVLLTDLRMGVECAYVFNFVVGKIKQEEVVSANYQKISGRPDLGKLSAIWDRIWDSSTSLAPALGSNQSMSSSKKVQSSSSCQGMAHQQ